MNVRITSAGIPGISGGNVTVTIPQGLTTATHRVDIPDGSPEDGKVTATLRSGSGYTLAPAPGNAAAVTISDQTVSVEPVTAAIQPGVAPQFRVTATSPIAETTTVNLSITVEEGITGIANANVTVVIPANAASALYTLPPAALAPGVDGRLVFAAVRPGDGYAPADPPDDRASVFVHNADFDGYGIILDIWTSPGV